LDGIRTQRRVEPECGNGGSRRLDEMEMTRVRSRTYALLRRLFLQGLTEEVFPYVQAIPELTSAIPEPIDVDEAAADHQQLFGFNVFPYQSIFLDPAGLLGGDETERVIRFYRETGFPTGTAGESADHIGHELGLLAFLSGAEADAWEDGLPTVAHRMSALQIDCLGQHLLRWLAPLALAIRQQGQLFYAALVELTIATVAAHWAGIGQEVDAEFALPAGPDLLEDERTGLREIAAFMLAPAYSGIYLSRDDIGRLAQKQKLPRGFGRRQDMLLNVMRSAVNYEALEALLASLQVLASESAAAYREMAARPQPLPYAAQWASHATGTAKLLAEIAARAEQAQP
jgi:TorA maturation chaperone TorD